MEATEAQGYLNTLVSAIPTEPLGLYTYLTAGIVGTIVIAFSTWGLVTPESPLNAKIDGDDQVVWTLIITTVGAGLLALMGLWLNEKVKR